MSDIVTIGGREKSVQPVIGYTLDGDGNPILAPSGSDASAANQATQITAEQAILAKLVAAPALEGGNLASILAKLTSDPATQTTLAAILAKIVTTPALEGGNLASILAKLTNDPATQTTLAAILAKIVATPALEGGNLASILAKLTSDPATQTTLAAILAKIVSAPALEGGNLASILAKLTSDPATQTTLALVNENLGAMRGYEYSTNAGIGLTTGAAVVTDANGTLQQYLRGLVKLIAAALGQAQLTPVTTTETDSTNSPVVAGFRSVTFILSTDFAGTINTATYAGANDAVAPFDAPAGFTLGEIAFTVTAGNARIIKI